MRRLAIALITYAGHPGSLRTEYALRTIAGICENLKLDDAEIGWYLADDGSHEEHFAAVQQSLINFDQRLIGLHHNRLGPGRSQNLAAANCFNWADIVLWMEDDWVLPEPYNVTKHYDMLLAGSHPSDLREIGLVRMGYLTTGVQAECIGRDWVHYLLLSKLTMYSFSGHPSLRHRRWWQKFGPYTTEGNAGQCEIDMDGRWRATPGPEIVWPLDQSGWGRFVHIGGEKA